MECILLATSSPDNSCLFSTSRIFWVRASWTNSICNCLTSSVRYSHRECNLLKL